MRRMLTEKDIEKVESIDPADIETLKAIDPTDIETLKATGSPKDASSGYVLTADGKGKATYQKISGGTTINSFFGQSISATGYKTDNDGNKFISATAETGANTQIIYLWMRSPLKADGVPIPRAEYTLTKQTDYNAIGGRDTVLIYFPDETITKHSITAQTKFTGMVSLFYK